MGAPAPLGSGIPFDREIHYHFPVAWEAAGPKLPRTGGASDFRKDSIAC